MPQKKYKLEENEPSCAMGSSAMANAKLRRWSLLVSQAVRWPKRFARLP